MAKRVRPKGKIEVGEMPPVSQWITETNFSLGHHRDSGTFVLIFHDNDLAVVLEDHQFDAIFEGMQMVKAELKCERASEGN